MLVFLQRKLWLQNPSLKHLTFHWIKGPVSRSIKNTGMRFSAISLDTSESQGDRPPWSSIYFTHICIISTKTEKTMLPNISSWIFSNIRKRYNERMPKILFWAFTTSQDKTEVFTLTAWDPLSSFMKCYLLMWQISGCLTALLHSKLLGKSSVH